MGTKKEIEISLNYIPRPEQEKIHLLMWEKRWGVIVCHRRFGKTLMSVNHEIVAGANCDLHNPRFAYIGPTYRQVKDIAWEYLKEYSRPIPEIKIHETELRVDYPGGARVRLYGADNPDALLGLYFDGVIFDEYEQMDPRVFTQIVRPALADRNGWAYFIGTPRGKNDFWKKYDEATRNPDWLTVLRKASQTGIIPKEELEQAQQVMSPEEYAQDFECLFDSAVMGAYFARELEQAKKEERVCKVVYQSAGPGVETWWDLGMDDETSIWFTQDIGREIHVLKFYECSGEGLDHYVNILKQESWPYLAHHAPHDISVRELGTGKSRWESALSKGLKFDTVPRIAEKADAIEAGRQLFKHCWFDQDGCKSGIEHLANYTKKWDRINQVWMAVPLHNQHSHGADAYLTLAQGHTFGKRGMASELAGRGAR